MTTIAEARKQINRIVREALPGLNPEARSRVARKIEAQVTEMVLDTHAEIRQLRKERDAAEKTAKAAFLGSTSKRELTGVIKTLQLILERENA